MVISKVALIFRMDRDIFSSIACLASIFPDMKHTNKTAYSFKKLIIMKMGSEYKNSHKLKDFTKRLHSNIHLVWRPNVDIKFIEHI